MELKVLELLETATIAVCGFLIKKYVFLEPDMEVKKQRIFYCASFLLIAIVFLFWGKDAATLAALFMIGVNACLGRKKHRLYGLFLMIPFTGIINGLLVPVLLVPPYFLRLSEQETCVYRFIFYGLLSVLLAIFYVKGKNWRSWFHENMKRRSLQTSEKYLLWIIGTLLMFFSSTDSAAMQIVADGNTFTTDNMNIDGIVSYIGVSSISAFVMTVTIIVLIMQGNKRTYLKMEKLRADAASEAKTEFLSSMSHDIRTPMNAILGMTKIAGTHLKEPERVADCLKKIDIAGEHLLELINEVLDMNKIESGKLELNMAPFDMGGLFEELFIMAKPLAEAKGHTFIADVDGIVEKLVTGDKSRLSQVLMNFISNSIKYTNNGGTVWFTATQREIEKDVAPQEVDSQNTSEVKEIEYTFIVKDNGIGMSEEYLPHLFDPFTRAKDDNVVKAQGTGLGMAITKKFVDLMDGELLVESKLGEGSTFTVKVILRTQTEAEQKELENRVDMDDFGKLDLSGKRVLLAEDNELNAEIAGEILGMTGLLVEYAVNGKEAVDKISVCEDGYYDFVLMDIQMPVLDGYEATTQIRQLDRAYTKQLPIIAMTANSFAEDVQKAKDMGMDGHIAKPLDLGQLMGILKNVCKP